MSDQTRVLVISDTHVPALSELPPRLLGELRVADLILHAGDHTGAQMVEDLRKLAPYYGVSGNMDPLEVRRALPAKQVIVVAGKRVGLIHGGGEGGDLAGRVLAMLGEQVDVLVYGHSHLAQNSVVDEVLMFNPGSVTKPWPGTSASFGVLTFGPLGVQGEIVNL